MTAMIKITEIVTVLEYRYIIRYIFWKAVSLLLSSSGITNSLPVNEGLASLRHAMCKCMIMGIALWPKELSSSDKVRN